MSIEIYDSEVNYVVAMLCAKAMWKHAETCSTEASLLSIGKTAEDAEERDYKERLAKVFDAKGYEFLAEAERILSELDETKAHWL
jgi:hypothetical protein